MCLTLVGNVCCAQLGLKTCMLPRFDNVHGSDPYGNPVDELPEEVLDSIRRNGVRALSPQYLCSPALPLLTVLSTR